MMYLISPRNAIIKTCLRAIARVLNLWEKLQPLFMHFFCQSDLRRLLLAPPGAQDETLRSPNSLKTTEYQSSSKRLVNWFYESRENWKEKAKLKQKKNCSILNYNTKCGMWVISFLYLL